MANTTPQPIEELLPKFLAADDDIESEAALDALFSKGVRPLVASVLRRKFNASLSTDDLTKRNLDALDLASDIDLQLLRLFRRLREEPNGTHLENPAAYVQTVIANAFRQHVREKYPQRLRLRNKITYIVRNSREFAAWERADDGRLVCGRREWSGMPEAAVPIRTQDVVPEVTDSEGGVDDNRRIVKLMGVLFSQVNGPVSVDELVSTIARWLGLKDRIEVTLEEAPELDDETSLERRITERISLQRFWDDIVALPVPHLTALLLNLRGEHGENILAFLPMLRIASVREIAEVLGVSADELASMWNDLPLDDNRIALRLGITRQQVINLRQSARAKLARSRKGKI